MRHLDRLRPGHHRPEIDELAVVFRLGAGPDRLHRLDPLPRQLVAGGEDGAVIGHLILVPAIADAEQEAPAGDLVDRGNRFRRLDRVALDNEADTGTELQRLRHHRRRAQRHEGVHHVVVLLRQVAAARIGRLAGQRDMRMLRRPEAVEAALLQRDGKLRRRHGVIREEHRAADLHGCLPWLYREGWPAGRAAARPLSRVGRPGRRRRSAAA